MVEENGSAIFMRKSVIYHATFWLNVILAFGLWIICLVMIHIQFPENKIFTKVSNYTLAILSYFVFSYNLHELLTNYFETIQSKEVVKKIDKFKELLEVAKMTQHESSEIISNDIYDLLRDNKGLSIFFRDVRYKISEKNYFEIPKLSVQNGEKIIIVGAASSLVIPILFKLIKPNTGEIRFGDSNIKSLQISDLSYIIGLIPADPFLPEATIKTLLKATNVTNHTVGDDEIEGALRILDLWDSVMMMKLKLDEKLSNFNQEDRQLFCLAKCLIKKPPVVLIEKPHPNIQAKVDQCVKIYLNLTTIIFITANANQFTVYDRVVELDKRVKHL